MPAPQLLNDRAMREFITRGYVSVQTDFSLAFHRDILEQADHIFTTEGNPGNDLLPKIPKLYDVLHHPAVDGVLTSILGPNYLIHPHRHCHLKEAHSAEQNLHNDSYEDDENVRHHRSRWAMAFYYPQDVTPDMGPTAVAPSTHYYNTADQAQQQPDVALSGPAGTVTFVHYDLWHRATANHSNKKRYMMKFLFCRLHEPERPSWNNRDTQWRALEESYPNDPPDNLCAHMWQWLSGATNQTGGHSESIETLLEELHHDKENTRLRAAYALGHLGAQAVPALIDTLHQEASAQLEANLEHRYTNPSQLYTAYALSSAGQAAVAPLVEILDHPDWWMRATAADILGDIGPVAQQAIPGLTRLVQDESSEWVRRNAAEALGTMGAAAAPAAPALATALRDEHSKVRHNAATALWRIGPQAAAAANQLRQALEDESYFVRNHAELALERLAAN
jgi:hypothetical protein